MLREGTYSCGHNAFVKVSLYHYFSCTNFLLGSRIYVWSRQIISLKIIVVATLICFENQRLKNSSNMEVHQPWVVFVHRKEKKQIQFLPFFSHLPFHLPRRYKASLSWYNSKYLMCAVRYLNLKHFLWFRINCFFFLHVGSCWITGGDFRLSTTLACLWVEVTLAFVL